MQTIKFTLFSFFILFKLKLESYQEKFSFKNIFYYFKNYRKNKKYKVFEEKLRTGILKKEIEIYKLMTTIQKVIKKEKYKHRTSKYIPFHRKTDIEIYTMILVEHGKYMKLLGIKLGKDLKFKK
jgi:hypothetical protein